MSYKIETIRTFDKQIKRLSKKHSSIKKDLLTLVHDLMANPQKGAPLGKNCFKIRLSITSKGKGKSGEARVITYVQIIDEIIYLLSIYDKSEKDTLIEGEIDMLLDEILD